MYSAESVAAVALATRSLRLPPTTALIFRTLAIHERSTAGQLARDLGIAAARVSESLDELRTAGLVHEHTTGRARTWRVARADQVRQMLSAPARRPIDRCTAALRQARVLASAEVALGPGITHLPSREAARQRVSGLIAAARHEHLTLNPEPVFDESAVSAAAVMDRQLMARGIRVRVIGVQPDNPSLLCAYGGEPCGPRLAYREAADVPMKLMVIDRRIAIFPVDPNDFNRGYLEISQPTVVESLVATFERRWADAGKPWEPMVPHIILTPREEALVGLLVHGHTDASAARELAISERSVSSIVRTLMDRLGVDNRFQLGVALGALRAAPLPPGVPIHQPPERSPAD